MPRGPRHTTGNTGCFFRGFCRCAIAGKRLYPHGMSFNQWIPKPYPFSALLFSSCAGQRARRTRCNRRWAAHFIIHGAPPDGKRRAALGAPACAALSPLSPFPFSRDMLYCFWWQPPGNTGEMCGRPAPSGAIPRVAAASHLYSQLSAATAASPFLLHIPPGGPCLLRVPEDIHGFCRDSGQRPHPL